MDRTTRTVILTLIYLVITISLLISAYIAMWRDQPDISLIALRYKSGTIEHHHGIGKERAYLCPQEHGSSYEVLKRIKNVLDPNNIFSPGTLMPIESLK